MPISYAILFRAVITMLLALHVFYMYCTARGMSETFGFHLGTSVIAGLFALAMLVPLVWAVALPELPEAISKSILPRRRWKRGQCPHCAYDMRGTFEPNNSLIPPPICPECGKEAREPPPPDMLQVSSRTAKRFLIVNLLAWIVGCSLGEAMMRIDEHRFEREARAWMKTGPGKMITRPRAWPNGDCSLNCTRSGSIFATE